MKLYHGTNESNFVEILKHGLKRYKGYVSLTPNFGYTVYFGLKQKYEKNMNITYPVTIEIILSDSYLKKLAEEGHLYSWGDTKHEKINYKFIEYETYEIMFNIDIPIKYISGYYKPKNEEVIKQTFRSMKEKINKDKTLFNIKNWKFYKL